MPSPDIDYSRNINKFSKLVVRNKWQVKVLPKWWPCVKNKPVIISEGDSWFDYPAKSLTDVLGVLLKYTIGLQNFGMDSNTNVIDVVSRNKKLDALFLRLERSGDYADELAAKQPDKKHGVWEDKFPSQTLYSALQNKTVAKHVDAILLSAGGNDLVDAVRHGVIEDYPQDWVGSHDKDKLDSAAQNVAEYYLQALLYRDEFAPNAKVLCHSYSYAVQVNRGTTTEFDFSDAGKLIGALIKFLKLEWIKKPLKTIGINLDDLGEYTIQSKSNLHETFDEKGWPKNPEHPKGEGVHPERALFIKSMLDSLYDAIQLLPSLYQEKTGKALYGFEHIDVRNEVQDPKYWSDFIHLNVAGYKVVGAKFVDKIISMLK